MRRDKKYQLFLLLFYFLLFRNPLEKVFPITKYGDEFISLLAIPIYVYKFIHGDYKITWNKKNSFWIYLFLMFFCGLAGNLIFRFQPFFQAVLPDILLCLKFWMALEVAKFLLFRFNLEFHAGNLFIHIKILTWFFLIFTIVDNIFHIYKADIRYGLRSTELFFSHPTHFGAAMVVLLVSLLLLHTSLGKGKYVYYFLLSLLCISTLRSKLLGAVFVFWMILYLAYFRRKKITLWSFLLFGPAAFIIGWDQIYYYFFSSIQLGSARYQLLVKSFQIAKDFFPIGTGFGTYASYYSGLYYSPVYYLYNLSNIQGLILGRTYFVSDSFWPLLLGQFGYIGTIAFIWALYILYRNIQKLRNIKLPYYVGGIFIFVYMLIDSTSESAFVHPNNLFFAVLLGYMLSFI